MRHVLLLAGFASLLSLACGCQPSAPTYDAKTIEMSDQFRKVVGAYNRAYEAKRKAPTAADLKPFLKQYGEPDVLLKSPRDGKPLVIVPGFDKEKQPVGDERSIIVYEEKGVDGKRMTVDIRGTVVLVPDDEFAKVKFVGGHTPGQR